VQQHAREWIAAQPDLTLQELQMKMREELALAASIGRLWKLLGEIELRLKKIALRRRARHHRRPTRP
jgi:hypothetical protein